MPYKDKKKQKQAQVEHYIRNKNKFQERRRIRKASYREEVRKYLSENPCTKCNEADPRKLSFHHREPDKKSFGIAASVSLRNLLELKEEIKKCDVLCGNCHRIYHFEEIVKTGVTRSSVRRAKIRVWFNDFLKSCSCVECGEDDYRVIDFHHRDRRTKEFEISKGLALIYNQEKIEKELIKCDPLCVNCHLVTHYEDREVIAE